MQKPIPEELRLALGSFSGEVEVSESNTVGVGNPVEDERDSGLKPNTIPF
jgi:hypothetical protein